MTSGIGSFLNSVTRGWVGEKGEFFLGRQPLCIPLFVLIWGFFFWGVGKVKLILVADNLYPFKSRHYGCLCHLRVNTSFRSKSSDFSFVLELTCSLSSGGFVGPY